MSGDATLGAATTDQGARSNVQADQALDEHVIPVRRSAEIREEPEDDGRYVLYEPEQEVVLAINGPGRAILELCDGRNTVGAIIGTLQQRYDVPASLDLRAEVLRYLDTLSKTGLVTLGETRS